MLTARSSRRRMPPEYVFDPPVAGVSEVERSEQFRVAGRAPPARGRCRSRAIISQVLLAGQQVVDGGVLPGEADRPSDRRPGR